MLPLDTSAPVRAEELTEDVEALLNPAEADGEFHDSAECAALLLVAGALLLSPPTPRPKKS
ncbi:MULTISPECIES: hypothetical protein [Streptomyces]|uniref:Uncharacterized protein n=1 Tax=Streptomyces albus (strain ATCC 21838 / DSM 41398 / FERM P-419 / JCM 4703 / NBRC 107858) TaxID=1081613 RepID=A0A0B5EQ40_STRA4|nr:hypothetical protein [Streptomyces sp. SCSIO ZS0520]AJE81390.1 hypothetical protein SLNWT_1014 [Streptomyces albus]AOU75706.1 hypothetical protein SLNHY_1015 [Streptomyces albus]AYN31507.1 hypothetical protein DUI70_1004 [Streptomyces albus]